MEVGHTRSIEATIEKSCYFILRMLIEELKLASTVLLLALLFLGVVILTEIMSLPLKMY